MKARQTSLYRTVITGWVAGRDRAAIVDFLSEDGALDLEQDIDPQLIDLASYPSLRRGDVVLLKALNDGTYLPIGFE